MIIEIWSQIDIFDEQKLKMNNFLIMLVSWAKKWI